MTASQEYYNIAYYENNIKHNRIVAENKVATKQIAKRGYSAIFVNRKIRERGKQKSATKPTKGK